MVRAVAAMVSATAPELARQDPSSAPSQNCRIAAVARPPVTAEATGTCGVPALTSIAPYTSRSPATTIGASCTEDRTDGQAKAVGSTLMSTVSRATAAATFSQGDAAGISIMTTPRKKSPAGPKKAPPRTAGAVAACSCRRAPRATGWVASRPADAINRPSRPRCSQARGVRLVR